MVKIVEYNAQDRKLLTDNQGFEAYQRSGRIIRGFEQDIGRDISEAGKLQGQTIRERAWPFDIAELDQHLVEQQAAKTPRVSFGRGRGGGGSSDSFRGPDFRGQDESTISGYDTHGQASRGAAALGSIARRLGGDSGSITAVDPITGTSTTRRSAGDQTIDPATGLPVGNGTPRSYTVQNGQFVPAGQAADNARIKQYNAGQQQAASINAQQAQGYWGSTPNGNANPQPTDYSGNAGSYDQNGNPISPPIPGGAPMPTDQSGVPLPTPAAPGYSDNPDDPGLYALPPTPAAVQSVGAWIGEANPDSPIGSDAGSAY